MATKQMVCEYASNNMNDASFVQGEVYEATREEDNKVFVKDRMGFSIQVVYGATSTVDGSGVWEANNNGTYRFRIASN